MKIYRLFDNNIFSGYKDVLTTDDLETSVLSIVIFYEATATKAKSRRADDEKWQEWNLRLHEHQNNNTLLIPSGLDWQTCAFAMRAMQQRHKVAEKATDLQNNVLICQSAITWQNQNDAIVIIVTENTKHFALIAKYLNDNVKKGQTRLVIESAADYFGL